MATTLSCQDNRLSLAQRNFTYTQLDPNRYKFCTPAFAAVCANPFPYSGQGAEAGVTVFSDNTKVTVNGQNVPLTCKQLVDYKLNESYDANFAPTNLYPIGCGVSTNSTTGRRQTGCSFSDAVFPTFVDSCQTFIAGSVVDDCNFRWACTVTVPDPTYKPVCCNALNANPDVMGQQTDPYTGLAFNALNACAPNWCLEDPAGECLALFNASCSTTSSCNRHAFLTSKFPISTTNDLVNTIVINNNVGGAAKQGFQCADWYEETKRQAELRKVYTTTTFSSIVNARVTDTMNIVKSFCANPETKGNGECSCINAYITTGAEFAQNLSANALTFQFDNADIPAMVQQTDVGSYRRVDAFCTPKNVGTYTQNWTDPLTYTLGTTTRTISNVCSQSGSFWFGSPQEYTLPTMNPNRNLNSLTNFGDVVNDTSVLQSFRNLDDNLNFAMPLHCWHPACVARNFNALDNPLAFLDLYAFTQTCPDICYMYSGADIVNIGGNVGDQTFIHINNDYQTCQFAGENSQYVYQPFPFALPSGCQQLVIQAPVNFSDTIHITVTNPQVDISELLQSKTMFAFSNLVPLVSFHSASSQTSSFGPTVLYKYSFSDYSGSTLTEDTLVLSVTVDTTGMTPFTSFQSEINLSDNSRNTQQIQVQVYVYPDNVGTGGATTTVYPFACGEVAFNQATGLLECILPCDCSFGSNSSATVCSTGFDTPNALLTHTTGFSVDGDPIVRPLRQLLAPSFGTNPITRLGPSAVGLAQALQYG